MKLSEIVVGENYAVSRSGLGRGELLDSNLQPRELQTSFTVGLASMFIEPETTLHDAASTFNPPGRVSPPKLHLRADDWVQVTVRGLRVPYGPKGRPTGVVVAGTAWTHTPPPQPIPFRIIVHQRTIHRQWDEHQMREALDVVFDQQLEDAWRSGNIILLRANRFGPDEPSLSYHDPSCPLILDLEYYSIRAPTRLDGTKMYDGDDRFPAVEHECLTGGQ